MRAAAGIAFVYSEIRTERYPVFREACNFIAYIHFIGISVKGICSPYGDSFAGVFKYNGPGGFIAVKLQVCP